jgi:fibronectin-binding autotransporter adhesin
VSNLNTQFATSVTLNLSPIFDTAVASLSGALAAASEGTNTATINVPAGRTLSVNQTAPATFAGGIAGDGSLVLAQTSTSALSLSGNNTYTGSTTVAGGTLEVSGSLNGTAEIEVKSGAIFALGGSNVINNTAILELAGGTFQTRGFSENESLTLGLGTLQLTGNSILDFGASENSQLLFAGVGSHTAGSFSLSIENWNGSIGSVDPGNDRFLFVGGEEVRLAFQNAFSQDDISFNGVNGFTTVQYEGHFEVMALAIPEPSSLMLGTLAAGLLGFRRRRVNS